MFNKTRYWPFSEAHNNKRTNKQKTRPRPSSQTGRSSLDSSSGYVVWTPCLEYTPDKRNTVLQESHNVVLFVFSVFCQQQHQSNNKQTCVADANTYPNHVLAEHIKAKWSLRDHLRSDIFWTIPESSQLNFRRKIRWKSTFTG